jgi:predicted nuclease of predicted toxin-antitoxin system
MNLILDEDIERQIVEKLRKNGHHILSIAEIDPGTTDEKILEKANEQKAILMTEDKDFGEMVFRQKKVSRGVILLRLEGLSNDKKAEMMSQILKEREKELAEAFTVITPGVIRIRKSK